MVAHEVVVIHGFFCAVARTTARESLSFRATFADGGTGWVLVASHTAAAAASRELSNIAQRLQSPDSGRACLIHQTNNSED